MRLRFAGDDVLVVVDRDARAIDLAAGGERVLDVDGDRLIDLVGFPDRIWAAERDANGGAVVVPLDLAGRRMGSPAALSTAPGAWAAASISTCAFWNGAAPASVIADGDGVAVTPMAERADLLVPQSAGRFAAVRGMHVALRTGAGARWSHAVLEPHQRVDAGAFLFDGSSLAVIAGGTGGTRSIVVLTARDGAVQQRLSFSAPSWVELAERRGQALVLLGDRKLVLVDLRFARTVGEHELPVPVAALAINASATRMAIASRGAGGELVLEHFAPRELISSAARAGVQAAAVIAEPIGAPPIATGTDVRADAAQPEPAARTRFELVDAPALAPRSRARRTEPAVARALLERERTLVAAMCYLATAQAWDQGRIVWDSESEHPYETELMGLLDRQRGRAADRAGDAGRALVEARAALAAAAQGAADTLSPIDELTAELGLSPLARQMLLVAAAPTIWGEIARLYGILANDDARGVVDEMMIRQVLGANADVHDIARELDPDRPLVRRGAIRVGAGSMRPFLALRVDPLVIERLRGDPLGEGADPSLRIVAPTRAIDALLLAPGVIDRLRDALGRAQAEPLRLIVRGRHGAGRLTLLAALAETANRRVALLDAAPLVRDGRVRADELALGVQRAALGGWLPCIDNLDVIGHDDRGAREQVREVLRAHPGPLALRLGTDVTPPVDPGYLAVDLAPLAESARLEAWTAALAEHQLELADVDELATRWVIGPGTIHRVLDQLRGGGDVDDRAATLGRLDNLIRQHLETRLGDLATRVARLASWSQIVLPSDVLDSLLELISRIHHRRTVFERWGYERVISSARGITALFQGGPGTGKTMVASAIARELGLDVYRVDLSRIVSKWIGETERNLAQLFDAAEDGQAMILFDEADSLFAKRTEVKTSVDRYANLEVNYLLQRLDSFGGLAILTTNFGGAIDAAFKRRLSFRLSFPFPDEEMREQLWRVHLPPEVPRAGALDLADLARKYKMSGGYIRNAALRAAFLAAAEESGLRHDHLERAVRLEYREIGKLAETGALE